MIIDLNVRNKEKKEMEQEETVAAANTKKRYMPYIYHCQENLEHFQELSRLGGPAVGNLPGLGMRRHKI